MHDFLFREGKPEINILIFFSGRYGGWHKDKERQPNQKNVPRVLVYIMGGATFSEFRVGYEVTSEKKTWEVIVGKCPC